MPRNIIIIKSQADLATYLGVSRARISEYLKEGMPGEKGKTSKDPGRYDAFLTAFWLGQRGYKKRGPKTGTDGHALNPMAEMKLKQAQQAIRKEDFDFELKLRRFMPVEETREKLDRFAAIIRKAGEDLYRMFGDEAQAVIDEALDKCEREVLDELVGSGEKS